MLARCEPPMQSGSGGVRTAASALSGMDSASGGERAPRARCREMTGFSLSDRVALDHIDRA